MPLGAQDIYRPLEHINIVAGIRHQMEEVGMGTHPSAEHRLDGGNWQLGQWKTLSSLESH